MIVATRDGQVLQGEELSREQKETAWAVIFRSYIAQHPETVQTGGRLQQEPAQAPE